MAKAAGKSVVEQSPQETETNRLEQIAGTVAEVLRLVQGADARLVRLESTRGKLMKGFKGTRLADLAFEFNIRFMEIFVSESSRVLQNMDKGQLQAFLDAWPSYVDAVQKADIAEKWIPARQKQGGHEDNPPVAEPSPAQTDASPEAALN